LPALIMIIMIPLTFSIANGIAIGFISYVVLKFAAGKKKGYQSWSMVSFYNILIKIYCIRLI
jgi:xanthine/uracil/vitamin C permease (AzgA family)